jgi:hypothetical protein
MGSLRSLNQRGDLTKDEWAEVLRREYRLSEFAIERILSCIDREDISFRQVEKDLDGIDPEAFRVLGSFTQKYEPLLKILKKAGKV